MRVLALAVLLVTPAAALLIKGPDKVSTNKTVAASKPPTTEVQVDALRSKLTKLSAGLQKMLDPKSALAKMDVGTTVQQFYTSLQAVLKDTEKKKDAKSLQALQSVAKNAQDVVKNLMSKQVQINSDNEAQEDSLLLGVLMTKQHEPMAAQLAVLKSEEFAKLPVTKAILAKQNMETPLFKQAAQYLDKHPSPKAAVAQPAKGAVADGHMAADLSDVVTSLQARLAKLEASTARAKKLHANTTASLEAAEKGDTKKDPARAHTIHLLRKKEDRKFAKMMAIEHNDEQTMKDAIAALKKGDVAALARAESALDNSVKAMESHNGGFLVLVQESLREAGMDCPFCAAQCVDKCHTAGKPYVQCLTDCADAGKE